MREKKQFFIKGLMAWLLEMDHLPLPRQKSGSMPDWSR